MKDSLFQRSFLIDAIKLEATEEQESAFKTKSSKKKNSAKVEKYL